MSTTDDRDDVETLPAPVLTLPTDKHAQWQREYDAFRALLPQLLQTHKGKYVAVYNGQVVDTDDDKIALGLRVYNTIGYVPICVALVSETLPFVRIPRFRILAE